MIHLIKKVDSNRFRPSSSKLIPFSVTPFSLLNRWLGDYGGQRQKFFPANYCEEINYVAEEEAKNNKYENGVDEESEAPVS